MSARHATMHEAAAPMPRLLVLLFLLVAGCSGDPSGPVDEPAGPPAQLLMTSGNLQSATLGGVLPDSLAVRVTDAGGKPVAGVAVSWEVTSGGGSLSASSTVTGASGHAMVRWTLGVSEGGHGVTARVSGLPEAAFTATAAASGAGVLGAAGGVLGLADGTRVLIPAGAVSGTAQITLAQGNASTHLDGFSAAERVLISLTSSVAQFAQPVEVRVPLPAGTTLADTGSVAVGRFDAAGVLVRFPFTLREVDGRVFAVVETTSFSNWLYEWFRGKYPPVTATLPVPFYGQSSSYACWAAVMQMLSQAVKPSTTESILEILGEARIDESDPSGGMDGATWRFGGAMETILRRRTGVKPTRELWAMGTQGVSRNLRDHVKNVIGLDSVPVGFFSTVKQHSVLLVGYDGDTFLVHDPDGVTDPPGYRRVPWSELTAGSGVGTSVYLSYVPKRLSATLPLSVNILPQAVALSHPRIGPIMPETYSFRWDHRDSGGYGFAVPQTNTTLQTLPGRVTTFSVPGLIQVINGSPTTAADLTYTLYVGAVGEADIFTHSYSATVPANKSASFVVPSIPVDSFRYNRATATEYFLLAEVKGADGLEAAQSIRFSIAGVTPELASITPATAGVGQEVVLTGQGFGQLRKRNRVVFNGVEVPAGDILQWTDETLRVRVPAGATTGSVTVHRGEVPSNAVPFTLSNLASVSGSYSGDDGGASLWGGSVVHGTSTWTLEGVEARELRSSNRIHWMSVKVNTPAELRVTAGTHVTPATWTQHLEGGGRVEYAYRTSLDVSITKEGTTEFTRTGTDEAFTVNFRLPGWWDRLRVDVGIMVYYDATHYNGEGQVTSTTINQQFGWFNLPAFWLEAKP